MRPTFVIHIGAHLAEELAAYEELDWGREGVVWIEADDLRAQRVSSKVKALSTHSVHNAVLSDVDGEVVTWWAADNGQSSSFLRPAEHLSQYPEIGFVDAGARRTTRFDSLSIKFPEHSRVLVNLDIQGAELRALKGFGNLLNQVDWIYSEVNRQELYEGVPLVGEIDGFLEQTGFRRVDTVMTKHGWGDALYCRQDVAPGFQSLRRAARKVFGVFAAVKAVSLGVRKRIGKR